MPVDLPLELKLIVFQLLALPRPYRSSKQRSFSPDERDARTTLKACSLVCRGWSAAAQRLLFRTVDFNFDHLGSFCMLMNSEGVRGALLAKWVEVLKFPSLSTDKYPGYSSIMRTILDATSHLRHLSLPLFPCSPDVLDFWSSKYQRLDSLSIHVPQTDISPKLTCVTQDLIDILRTFSTVRLLEIEWEHEEGLLPLPSSPGLHLTHLILRTKQETPYIPFLSSLLAMPDQSYLGLESLEVTQQIKWLCSGTSPGYELSSALAHFCKSLRSIEFEESVTYRMPLKSVLPSFSLCPDLERVSISGFPRVAFLQGLPKSIRELSVGGYVQLGVPTVLYPLIEALELFPQLDSFTWRGYQTHEQEGLLRRFCESREIRLDLDPVVHDDSM